MSGKIYIASKDVIFTPVPGGPLDTDREHSYLVFDADGSLTTLDDQEYISGFPETGNDATALSGAGKISLEIGEGYLTAEDSLDEDHNGSFNWTPEMRNYRLVADDSNANVTWQLMKSFAMSLWDGENTVSNGLSTSYVTTVDYSWHGANSNSVAASILNSLGLDFRLTTPLDEGGSTEVGLGLDGPDPLLPDFAGDFPGHTELLDGNNADVITAYAYASSLFTELDDDLYTLHDNAGMDTIKVQHGARLVIETDNALTSGNVVVLQDFSIGASSLGVFYTTTVGGVPIYTDDLGARSDSTNFSVASQDTAILRVARQFGANGRGADIIEVHGVNDRLIETYDLSQIEREDFGIAGINFSRLFTAYSGRPNVDGRDTDDFLYGTDGANILTGGHGYDTLRGGAGTDTYKWSIGDGSDTIYDNWGESDKISLSTKVSSSMVHAYASGSDLIVTIDETGAGFTIKGMASAVDTFVEDHIQNVVDERETPTAPIAPITGDVEWGTSVPHPENPPPLDYILEDLDDTRNGSGGNDHLEGRDGTDELNGLGGDDILDGGEGLFDVLNGGANDDWLVDGDGGTLNGDGGNDYIFGRGLSTLDGGEGNDWLDAGGFSTAHGGMNDDVLYGIDNATLNGDDGDDILYGDDDAVLYGDKDEDVLHGTGNATLHGGDDDDILYGEENAKLNGDDGDDILIGEGNVTLDGGDDDDTIYSDGTVIKVSEGNDIAVGTGVLEFDAGWDWLTNIVAQTQENGDLLITHPDGTVLIKDYAGSANGWSARFGAAGTPFDLNDKIVAFSHITTATIVFDGSNALGLALIETGSGNDSITTSNSNTTVNAAEGQNNINTRDGNDVISAGADIDIINSGDGNDEIHAGSGADIVNAGTGNDTVYGEAGDDTIVGGGGDDEIEGNAGNDTITTGTGNSSIAGGDGNDTITAGVGDTSIDGGNGNDVINANSGDSDIDGGDGDDTILSAATGTVHGGAGNDSIQALVSFSTAALTVYGDDGNDFINVSSSDGFVTAHGGDGNDEILSQDGANIIYGDAGNDAITLSTYAENTLAYGGDGDDTITVFGTDNIVDAGSGTNTLLISGSGNRVLFTGGNTSVVLSGSPIGTIIDFGSSESYGSLTFSYVSGNRDLLVTAGAGTLVLSNFGNDETPWNFAFGGASAPHAILNTVTNTGAASAYVLALQNTNDTITTGNFGDTINSYGGDDIINAGAGSNTIDAGSGNDTITALSTSFDFNSIAGGDGNDTIYSGAGGDILNGNAGADLIYGGDGTDTIDGGDDNDELHGDGGGDNITAGNGVDVVYGGLGNDTIHGNAGVDTLYGDDGVDSLYGETGNDVLYGGAGNDTLRGDDNDDMLYGEADSDTLIGGAGNDLLDGGLGNDIMAGNAGNDTYFVNSTSDGTFEQTSEGTDLIISTVNITALAANVENLDFAGTTGRTGNGNALANIINGTIAADTLSGLDGNDTLNGGDGDDTLSGGNDNDVLNGGIGDDAMTGGTGNDTYYVDSASDTITENASEGTDTVNSAIDYTLGSDVENLTFSGSTGRTGTGNSLANIIAGSSGADTLYGMDGNDTITGGTGADSMIGGTGDDTYYVDNSSDAITENVSEGADTVITTISLTLGANVENAQVSGSSGLSLAGNALDNTLTGGNGNDTLTGGAGTDILIGGSGNDTYYVDALDTVSDSSGTDTIIANGISYSLSNPTIENLDVTGFGLTATGNGGNNTIRGFGGNSVLYGLGGNDILISDSGNDTLDGGSGADQMSGGSGSDTYYVDSFSDVVTEGFSFGTDTIIASLDWTLGSNVENLQLVAGTGAITATGNGLANTITTGSDNNTLDGMAGADTLIGGAGNDTYYVDDAGDVVVENASEGTDTVYSSVSYTLSANVEDLRLLAAGTATGNALDNLLVGTSGADVLDGGTGADDLQGQNGNDTYYIDNVGDYIIESSSPSGGTDKIISSISINLSFYLNVENLELAVGGLTGTGNSNVNTLTGSSNADSLYGGGGNDILIGNGGNDILDGGTGNDDMTGGSGDDTYYVDSATDDAIESVSQGTDTIVTTLASYTIDANFENLQFSSTTSNRTGIGNSLNNVITGSLGADTLTGNAGNDTLDGGVGNDTLNGGNNDDRIISWAGADVIDAGSGTDTLVIDTGIGWGQVFYTKASNGSDLLIQVGARMITVEDHFGASQLETIEYGSGSTIATSGLFTGAQTGTGSANTINGNGSANIIHGLAGNDTLNGLGGNDVLDGGTGNDSMDGGLGDDIFFMDSTSDTVIEAAGQGTDTVVSSVNYTLGTNVENLSIMSTTGRTGTGNGSNNVIYGNVGNDTLSGGAGNDMLTGGDGNDSLSGGNNNDTLNMGLGTDTVSGGTGNDVFVYESGSLGSGTDTISDFSTTDDVLNLASLLGEYDPLQDAINDFVSYTTSGGNTTIKVDLFGTGGSYTNIATLTGVTLTGTIDDLIAGGQLIVEN